MSAPVRLVRDGVPLGPEALAARVLPLDRATADAYRAAAYATGQVLERDGLSIFGFGEAARLELREGLTKAAPRRAAELLAAIASEPAPGTDPALPRGVLGLGALAFAPVAASSLRLCELTVVATERAAAAYLLCPSGARAAVPAPDELLPAGPPPRAPDAFELTSARPHAEFLALVEGALEAIAQGRFDKVVLAREVTVVGNRPFVQAELVERLRSLYPSCATFALDGFIGASPELLCRRTGATLHCAPLAGTIARSGDPADDARRAAGLLASAKERAEHAYVVDAIASTLARLAARVEIAPEPELFELRNVTHLCTPITAELAPGERPGLLEIVAELHPTPAVGGSPREPALAHLARHEGLDRDRYAGPVGYLDAAGDGEFFLGIRSALLDGSRARLLAGVGIVAGSEPAAELAETQLKLQALLAAAVRP